MRGDRGTRTADSCKHGLQTTITHPAVLQRKEGFGKVLLSFCVSIVASAKMAC